MNFTKMGFLGFITEIVNCAAHVSRRSVKINIISAAASKHLGWEGFSSKEVNTIFNRTGNKISDAEANQSQHSSME